VTVISLRTQVDVENELKKKDQNDYELNKNKLTWKRTTVKERNEKTYGLLKTVSSTYAYETSS
jgi:hypothetical protein